MDVQSHDPWGPQGPEFGSLFFSKQKRKGNAMGKLKVAVPITTSIASWKKA